MMEFLTAIKALDVTTYQQLKTAVELRKWPDGRPLTKEQTSLCLEAILIYEHQQQLPEQQRTGFMPDNTCTSQTSSDDATTSQPITLIK